MPPSKPELPLLDGVELDMHFDPQEHDWQQQGNELVCSSCQKFHAHGTRIPAGLMLVGSKGTWKLVPEKGTPKDWEHTLY